MLTPNEICAREMSQFYKDYVVPYYEQPHRHYHNESHLKAMFALATSLRLKLTINQVFALWYHDAVYVPGASDNEAASAMLWQTICAQHKTVLRERHPDLKAERVTHMILDTKNHKPTTEESALVLDLDMSILGAQPAEYKQYAADIRREFALASDRDFVRGRLAFLNKLEDERIFLTRPFEHLERQAQINIRAESEALSPIFGD